MNTLDTYAIGEELTSPTGTTWTLVSKAPYTRRDGTPSGILNWVSVCARPECGAQIQATTGVSAEGHSALARKHCNDHKLTFAEVCKRGREVFKENCRIAREVKKQAKAAEKERAAAEKEAKRQALRTATAGLAPDKRRKLSDEDVAEIRKLSAEGFSSGDLAMVFPVSSSAIRNILGGRRRA